MSLFDHRPTLADSAAALKARVVPKGQIPTAKAVKAKKDRHAGKVVQSVRAQCDERDGPCRIGRPRPGDQVVGDPGACRGESQWMHLGEKTRAKTRKQAPEVRHTTQGSMMGCTAHHDRYDGRARPRLGIEQLTAKGADGPLRFTAHKKEQTV